MNIIKQHWNLDIKERLCND